MADQEQELGVFFDAIVVCWVTGSTQAGMIAGFAMQDSERNVLGIDASATVEQTRNQIARIARQTADAIGLGRELRDDEIVPLDECHAGTYGIPDARRSTQSASALGSRECSPIRCAKETPRRH